MNLFSYHQICQLNQKEFLVYNYISSHFQDIIHMNIRQLSDACGVSTTTILRFCEKMNCKGYTELKYQIKHALSLSSLASQNEFDFDPVLQYLNKMEREAEAQQILQNIADLCAQAKSIYVIGDGVSGSLASYAAYILTYAGKMALAITNIQYPYPSQDLEQAVVLVLSISGDHQQLISQIDSYKKHKAQIVSITNTDTCPLARISDLNLSYFMPALLIKDDSKELNLISQVPALYTLERIVFAVHQSLIQNLQK